MAGDGGARGSEPRRDRAARDGLSPGEGAVRVCIPGAYDPLHRRSSTARGRGRHPGARIRGATGSRRRRRPEPSMSEETLDQLQRAAFGYFLQAVNPGNGLVADTSRDASPSSIAVVGFALSTYPVAVERGWVSRSAAAAQALKELRFF